MPKVFTSDSQRTGEIGENIAVRFLMKHGFSILERNYTKKWGEIDIIAKKDGKIYFIAPDIKIYYLNFNRTSALRSPDGFEEAVAWLASSVLLMKRNDQPEQAGFLYSQWEKFMQEFISPDTNTQEKVDD